jgi:hypothetical protein
MAAGLAKIGMVNGGPLSITTKLDWRLKQGGCHLKLGLASGRNNSFMSPGVRGAAYHHLGLKGVLLEAA